MHEEIFIKQPQGFVVDGKTDMVYKLKKVLYGLKQASRVWYTRIDSHMINLGFLRSETESTLYVKNYQDKEQLIVSIYVDDLLINGGNHQLVQQFKQQKMKEFAM